MKEEVNNNDRGLHQFRLGSPETAPSSTNIAESASADKDNFCAHATAVQAYLWAYCQYIWSVTLQSWIITWSNVCHVVGWLTNYQHFKSSIWLLSSLEQSYFLFAFFFFLTTPWSIPLSPPPPQIQCKTDSDKGAGKKGGKSKSIEIVRPAIVLFF